MTEHNEQRLATSKCPPEKGRDEAGGEVFVGRCRSAKTPRPVKTTLSDDFTILQKHRIYNKIDLLSL